MSKPDLSPDSSSLLVDRSKLLKYSGQSCPITVFKWLKLFELYFPSKPESHLPFYLEDEAIIWYADTILGSNLTTWKAISERMASHFGSCIDSPLIAAQKRKLGLNEPVLGYYHEKTRLLSQTSLTIKEKIEQLSEGLPDSWKMALAAVRFATLDEWLQAALRVQASRAKSPQASSSFSGNRYLARPQSFAKANAARPNDSRRLDKRTQRPNERSGPSQPCRFCQERVNMDLYHWHRTCPFNPANTPNNTGTNHITNLAEDEITLN